MNEGITRTDHGVSGETLSPVHGSDKPENTSFALNEEEVPQPPAGFELLDEVGRGGMGLVYRARDLAFDREIALKFLQKKYELGSLHTLRFLEEARITGQLQHPGIPAVHQVGKLPDGRPFLVMKLIKGYTLSDMLWGKNRTSDADRPHVIPKNYLSIFEAICQAVGYAHAHQVIHRDLKPHNIMVGAFGEVQVMDWGLAKVMHQAEPFTEQTLDPEATRTVHSPSMIHTSGSELTTAGAVLGTPAYMPPEQAIGANTQLNAQSDVFGLGAILCSMLTGKPPFQGETAESTRLLSAMGMLSATFDRLDQCGAEPDLIALAKRCLAPKREDRPEDGGAVAKEVAQLRAATEERAKQAELERTKAEVHAQEQRHRRKVIMVASAAVISVLLIGIMGTTWGLFQAATKEKEATKAAEQEHAAKLAEEDQRKKAEASGSETQAVIEFVEQKVFSAARPEGWEMGLGKDVKLREALVAALKNIAEDFKDKPLIEARIRRTLASSFWYLGDYPLSMQQYDLAYQLYLKHVGENDVQALTTYLAIANLHDLQDHVKEAMQQRERVLELARKHHGLSEHVTLMAMNNLADSYRRMYRFEEVFKLREELLPLVLKKFGPTNAFTMLCMSNLAQASFEIGKRDEAMKLFPEALELQKQHMGPTHPNTLNTMNQQAMCLDQLGKHQEALPLYQAVLKGRQEKLGVDHPTTLNTMTQLAYCHSCVGQNEEALEMHRKALPLYEKQMGPSAEQTLNCHWFIVVMLFDMNRSGEAIPLIDTCLKRSVGEHANPNRVSAMYYLRCRHFKNQSKVKECQETFVDWEKRRLSRPDDQIYLSKAWSMMAALKREVEHAPGVEEADRAMEYLQKAQAGGWNKIRELETDKDFDSLRGRDDFRVLLAKLKKQEEEKKQADEAKKGQ